MSIEDSQTYPAVYAFFRYNSSYDNHQMQSLTREIPVDLPGFKRDVCVYSVRLVISIRWKPNWV